MPIKLTTTTKVGKKKKKYGAGDGEEKVKKVQKNLQNKSKHKNNKCFS